MNKDPLDELFGPPAEEPRPKSARERLTQEQAVRVRTTQLPTDNQKQNDDRARAAKPWIIVGIVAVLAIVASIVTVNLVRGGEDEVPAETTSTPSQTQVPTTTTPPSDTGETEADADSDANEEQPDGPPTVDVGGTSTMPIDAWGVTSEVSQRFGSTSYVIPDGTNLVLTSDLLNSFPESCADMRQQWGATRQADGTITVMKPASTCEEAPELYDEIWGLVDAWVKSIK